MQKIFITNLKKSLQEKVKGNVFVHIVDGTLVVEITATGILEWRYIVKNVDMQIVKGLSSKYMSQEIIKKYRNFILSVYFVQNNCDKVLTF